MDKCLQGEISERKELLECSHMCRMTSLVGAMCNKTGDLPFDPDVSAAAILDLIMEVDRSDLNYQTCETVRQWVRFNLWVNLDKEAPASHEKELRATHALIESLLPR